MKKATCMNKKTSIILLTIKQWIVHYHNISEIGIINIDLVR